MAVLQIATGKPAGSVFILNFAVTTLTMVHLQHRSGKLHSGKRVGAHGNLHHLRNGGDFGFLEGIPENRRCV